MSLWGLFREENREKARVFNDVFGLYEQTGTMLHEDLIDIRPIARMYGGFYNGQWEKWWPYIKYQRTGNLRGHGLRLSTSMEG
jgi:hypothetical protein